MVTVRIPRSLHEALRVEAHEHCTSMNKLCISKLLQFIDKEMVPTETSRRAGAGERRRDRAGREWTYKPGSVAWRPGRSRVRRADGHFSRRPIARPLQRSTRKSSRTGPVRRGVARNEVRPPSPCSLFDLAPGGVCLARLVAQPAGELLPHRFTLTARAWARVAVCFLLHFPWPRGRWALPITMSCGARTFLPPSAKVDKATSKAARPATIRSTPNPAQSLRYPGRRRGARVWGG